MGEAVTIRVSNQLGASLPSGARRSMLVGVALAAALAAATCVPLLLLRTFWASLFTKDAVVLQLVTSCIPYLAASLLADSVNTVMSKVIYGAGRQGTGSLVNFVCFWLVGLPLAGLLGLRLGFGAVGLWQAMAVSSALQAVVMAALVGSFDWKKESARAMGRVREQAAAA
jgi:MATE family multidrug resistance protein